MRVIGCGNPHAGDDAAGILAVERARADLEALGADVVPAASPLDVVHLAEGADVLVVVDAIRTPDGGRTPGTLVRAESGPEGLPAEIRSSLSSHGLGVAEAVGLVAAIRPGARVVVLGVEVESATAGGPLTEAVRRAVPELAASVIAEAAGANGRRGQTRPRSAREFEVRGIVQGVGFRPFVWRLATQVGLAGRVRNRGGVVEIVVEGDPEALDEFTDRLGREHPPMATVESIRRRDVPPVGFAGFEVEESEATPGGERLVPPDIATCDACLGELLDPTDRRYRYPFINCTDCGPRFTIIESLPYDRERTSMRAFPLCRDCASEYRDPADRRFHAEPIACPACGPTVELMGADGSPLPGDPIEAAARLLTDGAVLALKGLGGFHLACDATDDDVVARLRERKGRPDKPFAVMVADVDEARRRFALTPEEEAALASPQAPIVLVRDRGTIAAGVAPGHRRQGVMLPSTPLHHLLLRAAGRPLVMTSGNRSDEPICIANPEALRRLAGIADAFLVHDREIVSRYDDSVVRVWRGEPVVLRRARGVAPAPLDLSRTVVPSLGTGAELYGAFCLAAGRTAFLSQHIGDLDTDEAMTAYRTALDRAERIFGVLPELVGHDLHPDFPSTRLAEALGIPRVPVQHHHAHVASVMAEHRLDGPVIGVAYDGFGLGTDGSAWGGELLVCDAASAERIGHLRPVALPGGDAAVRAPWRMALAHAEAAGVVDEAIPWFAPHGDELEVVLALIRSATGPSTTSSMGRLFDAVAAVAGIADASTYEGHPAILLEQAADTAETRPYPFEVATADGGVLIDPRPTVAAVVRDRHRDRPRAEIAGRFHRTIAAATLEACRTVRETTGLRRVCLSGGVFANDLLTSDLVASLEAAGFEVFLPRRAPVGDGGLALGQVLVANATVAG